MLDIAVLKPCEKDQHGRKEGGREGKGREKLKGEESPYLKRDSRLEKFY